jgi:mono/diheme cytochrome c family protein
MLPESYERETHEHLAQVREQSEPFEQTRPIPLLIFVLIATLIAWAVYYIATAGLGDAAELGDRRTLSTLAVASVAEVTPDTAVDGEQIFAAQCVACHQATGQGIPGAFPPLAGSEWVNGSPKILANILLHGIQGNLTVVGRPFNGAMPSFKDKLNDAEIAAVLTHIRSQWGNGASPVAAALVIDVRKSTAARTGAWNGDTELNNLPKD